MSKSLAIQPSNRMDFSTPAKIIHNERAIDDGSGIRVLMTPQLQNNLCLRNQNPVHDINTCLLLLHWLGKMNGITCNLLTCFSQTNIFVSLRLQTLFGFFFLFPVEFEGVCKLQPPFLFRSSSSPDKAQAAATSADLSPATMSDRAPESGFSVLDSSAATA